VRSIQLGTPSQELRRLRGDRPAWRSWRPPRPLVLALRRPPFCSGAAGESFDPEEVAQWIVTLPKAK
jgi:hypothetical protein